MARITENSRQLKSPPIIIIGEGITEQYYFTHINLLFNYKVTIKPFFFGTTSLTEMDRKIKKVIDGGGIAICVFDADVSERNDAEKKKMENLRRKYSKKKSVILCDSLPSIEYWFLLHFCETNKYFKDSKSVERELRKFISQYEKKKVFLEKEKWVSDLCADEKLEIAQRRAKIFSNKEGSYSNIYRVFETLKETSEKK